VETAGGDTPDLATLDAAAERVIGESLFNHVSESRVRAALDPTESVASRDSAGGPAPAVVADALDSADAGIERDARVVDATRAALDDAAETLAAEVSQYA
jgi:argininosuccinate lyase